MFVTFLSILSSYNCKSTTPYIPKWAHQTRQSGGKNYLLASALQWLQSENKVAPFFPFLQIIFHFFDKAIVIDVKIHNKNG